MNNNSYTINGQDYPRVTTVLGLLDKSPYLVPWAARLTADHIRENPDDPDVYEKAVDVWKHTSRTARDIGSAVHRMIKSYINIKIQKSLHLRSHSDIVRVLILKDYDPLEDPANFSTEELEKIWVAFDAFQKWEKDNVIEWLESELTVYSENGYAGTLDAIAVLKDRGKYVIDFKVSSGFYEGYDLQIAAYRHGYEERLNQGKEAIHMIDGQLILRLDKTTGMPEEKEYFEYERKVEAFLCLLGFYYLSKNRRLKNNPIATKIKKGGLKDVWNNK
jgi:hypothetical protein